MGAYPSGPRHGLSLCAGGGGLDLGLMLAEPDFHTRCFVEWEEYPRQAIIAGQRAGYFAPAPIWDDLRTFDARPWAGRIDTLLAGYPCQPFSAAGKRLGEDDERHLWPEVARCARELGPGLEWIFLENVAGHVSLGLETVLRELWDMGFTPAAGLFSAGETGAAHERLRIFIVAHRNRDGCERGAQLCARRHADQGQCGADAERSGLVLGHASGIGRGKGGAQPEIRGRGDAAPGAGRAMDDAAGARCDGAGIRPAAELESGQSLPRAGRPAMADADGRNTGAEREQRSREQRFQPQGGGAGAGHQQLVDAESHRWGEGWAGPELWIGRDASPASAGGAMANAGGRRPDGSAAGQDQQSGRTQAIGAGAAMAHPSRTELEGIERGQHHPGGWQVPDGYPALPGGTGLHPPGPGDLAGWAAVLATRPDLAPAVSLRDVKRAADHFAQMVARGELAEAAAESIVRGMADGLAARSRALRLLGNGVMPLQAALAWVTLAGAHGLEPIEWSNAKPARKNFKPAID